MYHEYLWHSDYVGAVGAARAFAFKYLTFVCILIILVISTTVNIFLVKTTSLFIFNKKEALILDIINKILSVMKEKKISQKSLADFLDVREYTISQWKNGKSQSYMKYINKIADFLGVTTDYLLGTPSIDLSEKQAKIIELTSQLTEEEQEEVIKYAELLKRGRK